MEQLKASDGTKPEEMPGIGFGLVWHNACSVIRDSNNENDGNMDEHIELLRLLARFKLQVRRELDQAVDLERLKNDIEYARTRLAEIEESTADEEVLLTVLRLREKLLPGHYVMVSAAVDPAVTEQRYLFGARS